MSRPPACHYYFKVPVIVQLKKKHLLVTPSFKTNIMKFSIAYRGAILWNRSPGECCKAVSLGRFIKRFHESNTIKETDFSNLYVQ